MSARRTVERAVWATYAPYCLHFLGANGERAGTVATWHGYVRVYVLAKRAVYHFLWGGRHHRLVVSGGPPLSDRGLVRIARRFARVVADGKVRP